MFDKQLQQFIDIGLDQKIVKCFVPYIINDENAWERKGICYSVYKHAPYIINVGKQKELFSILKKLSRRNIVEFIKAYKFEYNIYCYNEHEYNFKEVKVKNSDFIDKHIFLFMINDIKVGFRLTPCFYSSDYNFEKVFTKNNSKHAILEFVEQCRKSKRGE